MLWIFLKNETYFPLFVKIKLGFFKFLYGSVLTPAFQLRALAFINRCGKVELVL